LSAERPIEMNVSKAIAVGLLLAVVCATSGCNPFRRKNADLVCKGPEGYAEAQSVPPLQIPAGLESPDTRNALKVPELNTPAPPPRKLSEGCLDEPPPYVIAKPKEPEA
jgi:uncharacterized lipoprotein